MSGLAIAIEKAGLYVYSLNAPRKFDHSGRDTTESLKLSFAAATGRLQLISLGQKVFAIRFNILTAPISI